MLEKIRLIALDVDGVLTDGSILVLEDGLQARRMSIRDGYALQLAVKRGLPVMVISGAFSEPVIDRLQKLGVMDVHMGVHDKWGFLQQQIAERNISASEVLFMGDDIPDLQVMQNVGVAACPSDAADEIKDIAHIISDRKGGEGCVRDILEQVMKAQGKWTHDVHIPSK